MGATRSRIIQDERLLARQLGGVGYDIRNLVPLYRSANRAMLTYENQIAAALSEPGTVFYSAKAKYDGSNPVPVRVDLNAYLVSATGRDLLLSVPVYNKP